MSDALASLAAGATVVTPNRRLSRHLIDAHDRAQVAAGRRAWPSARALPWTAFVAALDDEAVAAGALAARMRLSPHAVLLLWRAAIEEDAQSVPEAGALAELAAEAWALVHAHGTGAGIWRAWAGRDDEPAAFARWAERYQAALDARRAIDLAMVPDRVARAAGAMASWRDCRIGFAGFLDFDPQQRRVVDALERAGARVDRVSTLGDTPAGPRRAEFASSRRELVAALAWARAEVERRPSARVGIVVPDLAQRLAAVRLDAIDVLGLPGEDADRSPAWNLSLGAPLDSVPIVAAALDLIALAWRALPVGRAAALLRSAYVAGAADGTRLRRAGVEREWLERGVDPVRIGDAIGALQARDDALAPRLAAMAALAKRTRRATRHGWIDAWREALAIAGWPGDRPPGSAEHQARGALDGHFAAYAALDGLELRGRGEFAAGEACGAVAGILASSPFQPESPDAPIQILGLYEAVGLPFDALWISGMSDEMLPRAPRPHPLLPAGWQRAHGVPRSDAARELAHARDIASWLLRAAPDVVASHASAIDDRPVSRSAVFPEVAVTAAPEPATPARAQFDARPRLERLADDVAPACAPGERVRAGSGLVAAQSDCPFQALASKRWRADPWPEAAATLTSMERGSLVHAALASFWRATADHATLVALRADPARYAAARRAAASEAITGFDPARWGRIPGAVRALEEDRLAQVVGEWLAVEAARPPFAVVGVEHQASLALAPFTLDLRLARVDRLADGGVAILDYKTGGVPGIAAWRADRPEAVQMALYTLAWRAANPAEPVRAAVMGEVRRGQVQATGLYADAGARFDDRPGGREPVVVDWPELEARWNGLIGGLGAAFARGDAAVVPRERGVCRHCSRESLCRIGTRPATDEEGGA
ncbi:MAG: PD-(D/E)XK nuclease family protein [Burkholderiales bacterium]|nr:PD-(D/E)XK nuclease family protein [Burkholderiales bacterium]